MSLLTSIFLKTLRDNRAGILGWGLGMAAIMVAGAAQFPLVIQGTGAEREKQIGLIERAIDLAVFQGIAMVSTGSRRDPSVSASDNVRLFQLAYTPLAKYAEQKGVKLVFENWPNDGRHWLWSA